MNNFDKWEAGQKEFMNDIAGIPRKPVVVPDNTDYKTKYLELRTSLKEILQYAVDTPQIKKPELTTKLTDILIP
jgi:hypothetical protein